MEGYRKVIETIYTPDEYFNRALQAYRRLPEERTENDEKIASAA